MEWILQSHMLHVITCEGYVSGRRLHPLGNVIPSSGMSSDTSSPSKITSKYGPASAPSSE